jgi:hypothetical protein
MNRGNFLRVIPSCICSTIQEGSICHSSWNQNKIVNIKTLREHWIYKKPDATCPSTNCYVDSSTNICTSVPNNFIRCWLAAIRAEMAEGPKRVQLNFRDLADGRLDGTGSWGLTDGRHNR